MNSAVKPGDLGGPSVTRLIKTKSRTERVRFEPVSGSKSAKLEKTGTVGFLIQTGPNPVLNTPNQHW